MKRINACWLALALLAVAGGAWAGQPAVPMDPVAARVAEWSRQLPPSLRERDWANVLHQVALAQGKDAHELARDAARPDAGWLTSTLETAEVVSAGAGRDYVLLFPSCECSSINIRAWLVGAQGLPHSWTFESGINAFRRERGGFTLIADHDLDGDANCCASVKQALTVRLGTGTPVESVRFLPGRLDETEGCRTLWRMLDMDDEPRVNLSALSSPTRDALRHAASACLEQRLRVARARPDGGLALALPGMPTSIRWDKAMQRWVVEASESTRSE